MYKTNLFWRVRYNYLGKPEQWPEIPQVILRLCEDMCIIISMSSPRDSRGLPSFCKVLYTLSGSNTDDSNIEVILNSFLSPLEKIP